MDAYRKAEEWREDGKNEIRNKLQSIEITENGRYSVEDLAEKVFIVFDGNSYFDTGIVPTEQTKIEVMFRCQGENWYEDMYILGCSQLNLHIGGTALNGRWAEVQTGNIPYYENVWTSATLTEITYVQIMDVQIGMKVTRIVVGKAIMKPLKSVNSVMSNYLNNRLLM